MSDSIIYTKKKKRGKSDCQCFQPIKALLEQDRTEVSPFFQSGIPDKQGKVSDAPFNQEKEHRGCGYWWGNPFPIIRDRELSRRPASLLDLCTICS